MITMTTLLAFSAASLILALMPGPDMLYIVARSLGQGRKAGLASVLGIYTGVVVHISAAALGLSALLASSVTAFTIVKYLGAAYLIGLGIQTLLSRKGGSSVPDLKNVRLSRIYVQGILTNVLNPKVALFFLAFLPQFVQPGRGDITLQILTLGGIFIFSAIGIDVAVALLAGISGDWLRRRAKLGLGLRWLSGLLLLLLGAGTLMAGPRKP